jgi:hypothetical protein
MHILAPIVLCKAALLFIAFKYVRDSDDPPLRFKVQNPSTGEWENFCCVKMDDLIYSDYHIHRIIASAFLYYFNLQKS